MHDTAMKYGKLFFSTYLADGAGKTIVDIGAQDVNGSLRDVAPPSVNYVGVDFVKGRGVDVVIQSPYELPFEDSSVDAVVCSSCFEHSEFFWLVFEEMLRITKENGLIYLNVPSNGAFHRYPVDCWRFYPDSGRALVNWGRRKGYEPALLESFIANQGFDIWNDFVAVFVKSEQAAGDYPRRMIKSITSYTNGLCHPDEDFSKYELLPQDARRLSIERVGKGIVYYALALRAKITGNYRVRA